MTQAIILFAHGARDPRWSQPFEAVAEHLRSLRPGTAVRLAFLEFMTPTLLEAAEELAQGGWTEVSVVPMFLGAGAMSAGTCHSWWQPSNCGILRSSGA